MTSQHLSVNLRPAPPRSALKKRAELGLWGASFLAALFFHAGCAAFILLWPAPTPEMAGSEAAVMIDLAPVAVAATDVPVETPAADAAQDEPEPVEPPQETPEETPPEPTLPDPQPPPPPPAQSAVEIPSPKPPPPKPPEPARKPQQRSASAPVAAAKQAAKPAAPRQGAAPSNPASAASWQARIAAHLQRFKRYPLDARDNRQTGVAVLAFVVNRDGEVLRSSIARGSGSAALDAETLAMIRRAQPLPRPPSDVAGASFPFSVPIRYNLQ